MNRKEIEKMFDEKFNGDMIINDGYHDYPISDEIKSYIFDTIIPEVLKSILVYEGHGINPIKEKRKYANKLIKQKAKELYNITL